MKIHAEDCDVEKKNLQKKRKKEIKKKEKISIYIMLAVS